MYNNLFIRQTYIQCPFCFILVMWSGVKFAMLFMLILTTAMVSGSLSPELLRLNYGVVFEPEAHIHLSRENWIHTFEVQLPNDFNLITLSGCTRDKNTCSIVNNILLEIYQIRHETELTINHTVQTIKSLVPERQLTNNGRS